MKPITQTINAALAIAAFAFALPSYAIVIPVGTTPADDLLINYDFSGATPPPPYDSINTDFSFSGFHAGEIVTYDVFHGLNGTDFFFDGTVSGIVGLTITFPCCGLPDLLDGAYSVGFRLNQGAVDLDPNLSATGFNFAGANATIQGSVVSVVPEPATLALLGIGLAGLAAFRRRELN